jgi:hypothetical protein
VTPRQRLDLRRSAEVALALNLVPCFTPAESPESNGMAEAFVKTFKRHCVRVNPIPDAAAALALVESWMEDGDPPIWREIEVPVAVTLKPPHTDIQAAIAWEDAHLYGHFGLRWAEQPMTRQSPFS